MWWWKTRAIEGKGELLVDGAVANASRTRCSFPFYALSGFCLGRGATRQQGGKPHGPLTRDSIRPSVFPDWVELRIALETKPP